MEKGFNDIEFVEGKPFLVWGLPVVQRKDTACGGLLTNSYFAIVGPEGYGNCGCIRIDGHNGAWGPFLSSLLRRRHHPRLELAVNFARPQLARLFMRSRRATDSEDGPVVKTQCNINGFGSVWYHSKIVHHVEGALIEDEYHTCIDGIHLKVGRVPPRGEANMYSTAYKWQVCGWLDGHWRMAFRGRSFVELSEAFEFAQRMLALTKLKGVQ